MSSSSIWDEADMICCYSRADAIEDGVLIDISAVAQEEGFRFPVAVTATVWEEYIKPDTTPGQSVRGRVHDTLHMLTMAILARTEHGESIFFSLFYTIEGRKTLVRLKAICGPGDKGEPVVTIMLPEED